MKRSIWALFVFPLLGLALACAPAKQPLCRHNAIRDALNWQEVTRTRIAYGNLYGNPHVQAQAYMCSQGRCRWLFVDSPWLVESIQGFRIQKYYGLKNYINMVFQGETSAGPVVEPQKQKVKTFQQ